jgi:hypothetical protein
MTKITNIVELGDAMNRIARWRAYVGEEFETKAFFISLKDIVDLYEEVMKNQGTGVRAYLARNDEGTDELLLVGVINDETPGDGGRDIIMMDGASTIYDLTSPCPNMCDFRSPLFAIPDDKEKLDLSQLPRK